MTTDMFSQPATPAGPSPFEQPGKVAAHEPLREEGNSRWMPHPDTGKITRFTRASGWAITDETILVEWKIGMAVYGVTKNHDLYAIGNSIPTPDEDMEFRQKGWWLPWADLGHKAMDRAGSMVGAHLGTAFHAWREQYEDGRIQISDIPEAWQDHMRAFIRIHRALGSKFHPEYVEIPVLNMGLHNGVSGRLDNLREQPDGRLVVDDTKTGKSAPEGMDEIAIQMSIYANAEWHYLPTHLNANKFGYVRPPENIRRDVATITWIPINAPENARVIPIDIERGWEAAKGCAWLRQYWNRSKRKNNGLELPLEALWSDAGSVREEPVSVFDLKARIDSCITLSELSQVVMNAAAEDRWTPALEELAIARQREIRGRKKRK